MAKPDDTAEYVLNPRLTLTAQLEVPTRGAPLRILPLDLDEEEHVLLARLAAQTRASDGELVSLASLELDVDTQEALIELGIAVRRDRVTTVPRLELTLEELCRSPGELAQYDGFPDFNASALSVNPKVWAWRNDPATRTADPYARIFQPHASPTDHPPANTTAWLVEDPRSHFVWPVLLGPELGAVWSELQNGVAPKTLALDTRRALVAARLLVPPDPSFEVWVKESQRALREEGYVVLRNIVAPAYALALRRYADSLEASGRMNLDGDEHTGTIRSVRHNDAVMRSMHWAMEPLVRAITASFPGAPHRCSYCYMGIYRRGSALLRHRDRPQCRWNVSVCLGTQPFLSRDQQWPIWVESSGQPKRVALGISDGVLYAGTELPHWRDPLVESDQYAACFFHFVDADYFGPTD